MNFDAVAQYMNDVMCKEHHVPGCDIIVMRDHKQLYRYFCGVRDYEGKTPLDEHVLYYYYSCTKPVTVAAVMRLVEEGKLKLDTPVSDYLPAFGNVFLERDGKKVPPANPITVWHLFTMSSGLDYNAQNEAKIRLVEESHNQASTQEIVNTFPTRPLLFNPGEEFCYSLSHDVLAAVAEVVTGMRFSDYLDQVVFTPLEMRDSTFRKRADMDARLCAQYRADKDGNLIERHNNPLIYTDNYDSGGAGLISNTSDYAKFVDTMACDGLAANGYRLLKPETIDLLRTNQMPLLKKPETFHCVQGDEYGYGFGVRTRIRQNPGRRVPLGEFAWDGASGTYGLIDTKNHLSVSFAMHVVDWPNICIGDHLQLVDRIYEALDL